MGRASAIAERRDVVRYNYRKMFKAIERHMLDKHVTGQYGMRCFKCIELLHPKSIKCVKKKGGEK